MENMLLNRRSWLEMVGAAGLALAGMPAIGADDNKLRDWAKQNLKLGIMSAVYGGMPVAEAAKRIKADGFHAVVCDFAFADARFDVLNPDWNVAKTITSAFEKEGLPIVCLYGYYNVIDPNEPRRKGLEARMEAILAAGKRLGCSVVATGTGTLNKDSEWGDDPGNASEAAYVQSRDALAKLARIAEKNNAVVAIECYWKSVINSIERAERLFHDVPSPGLKLVMDPCNFYRKADFPRMVPMLEEMFAKLGDRIGVVHAKDTKPSANRDDTDLPAAGLGALDYPTFLRLLARRGKPDYPILEHLALPDVPRARDFVRAQYDKI